jgi:hypothetical protein
MTVVEGEWIRSAGPLAHGANTPIGGYHTIFGLLVSKFGQIIMSLNPCMLIPSVRDIVRTGISISSDGNRGTHSRVRPLHLR